jgi:hypothetical protein
MNQLELSHLNDDAAIKPFNAPQEEVRRTSISVTCSVMYRQPRAWRIGSTVAPLIKYSHRV